MFKAIDGQDRITRKTLNVHQHLHPTVLHTDPRDNYITYDDVFGVNSLYSFKQIKFIKSIKSNQIVRAIQKQVSDCD